MSLEFDLDYFAGRLSESAKHENEKVRERIAKLCREMRSLRGFVENLSTHVDFIGSDIKGLSDYFRNPSKRKVVFCAGCHKDITLQGGWKFPQEPGRYYCLDCQDKKFHANLDARYGA